MLGEARTLPGVTVVIPVYNYASYLAEAIRSALTQEYSGKLEVLVVDDGSTDESPSVIASFGSAISSHRQPNAGLSAARNTGMRLATHDLVVFLDADDLLEPTCVQELVGARQPLPDEKKEPVVIGSRGRMIDANGAFLSELASDLDGRVERFEVSDFILRNRFAPIVLADRRVLLGLEGFDTKLPASEDRDMWIRAATVGPVVLVHRALHRKRDHGANMSRHAERQTSCILRVLEKAKQQSGIPLNSRVWAEAEAVCLFQSARMYLAAGERKMAIKQCVRSLRRAWWLSCTQEVGYPAGFRARFLLLQLGRALGFGKAPAATGGDGKEGNWTPVNLKTR
ncbi:glycosyltransferase family A protein [Roseimicrobium sp. ORNL1]|uniref:glycosyltransferase family 2 protein n=1 Tax=Roseimicrobium sp. ORNL1 TaxID=2711231 RepID=UPI0013E2007B|nr:glycosyltransferase family A protein [Roseimicrobium sp. ORNL1]QIF03880.1 glycosyltransferase family 2 protein [Roseimicrobium sp. ORNL1]